VADRHDIIGTMPATGHGQLGKWVLSDQAKFHHLTQLLCFPHTGGCASSYRDWLADLASDVDLLPVQLPGRETRIREPLVTDMTELVTRIVDVVASVRFRRLALFGHSLGAIIATKVCESLEQRGVNVAHLLVSGYPAPSIDNLYPPDIEYSKDRPFFVPAHASDEILAHSLESYGEHLDWLTEPQLRKLFLPVVRADIQLLLSGDLLHERVQAPLTVLAGTADPLLRGKDPSEWAKVTRSDCVVYRPPGGHFYLASSDGRLTEIIRSRLGLMTSRQR
jgi:pyochelin biosynthetic protein PchC